MPSAGQQHCVICGNNLFPYYPNEDKPEKDGWRCPKCKAQYDWNEGFMLSAHWAAEEIQRLQRFERQDHDIRTSHGWKRDGRELPEIIQQVMATITDTLPTCWQLNATKTNVAQDCPVAPGMVMYFYFGPSYRIELYKRTVRTIESDGWMTWVEEGPERGRNSEDCFNSHAAAEFTEKT